MNPKEKAKELFEKYFIELKEHQGYYDLETAKQCVIIAVDEIINELEKWCELDNYWEEIKQEINKL
jgi:hypothetical protein